MQFEFDRSTGVLSANGAPIATGYAGKGPGKNNPAMEQVEHVGPLPKGEYEIGKPFKHPVTGPISMRLKPLPGTQLYKRSGFLIHGDSKTRPGDASTGCIVLPPQVRRFIANHPGTINVR